MAGSQEYRSLAADQRRAAEQCELERLRQLYLSSAQRFEALADEMELCEPRGRRLSIPAVIY